MVVTYRLVVTGSGSSSLMTTGSGCGGDVGGGGGGVRLWCGVVWVAVVGIDAAVTWQMVCNVVGDGCGKGLVVEMVSKER